MKKILIELPTWLGDAVMATPAIENIAAAYPEARLTLFGSAVPIAVFERHPQVERRVIDESRKAASRAGWLFRTARNLGRFDAAITFRRTLASRGFINCSKARRKGYYRRHTRQTQHLVLRYNTFINRFFGLQSTPGGLKIHFDARRPAQPTLGINPGASYGSAKRWYPEKFAEVARALNQRYRIQIFGGPAETGIAADIETRLRAEGVDCENLAGKTSVRELCERIGGLDLFITGDSGPMHVAAAYGIPTVAIFGPTRDDETAQWMNPRGVIVKKALPCSPCMKRQCPLGHHDCMKQIDPGDVLAQVEAITAESGR